MNDILFKKSDAVETQRCRIEALDFDWIFKGNNASRFLKLLSESDNGALCEQKSVRIFIELMWDQFQPNIIKYVFLPYLFYLFSFILLSSIYAGNYLFDLKSA